MFHRIGDCLKYSAVWCDTAMNVILRPTLLLARRSDHGTVDAILHHTYFPSIHAMTNNDGATHITVEDDR